MIEQDTETLVNVDKKKVHLRVLLTAIKTNELHSVGIDGEELGVTLGDLGDLMSVMTPGVNVWWSAIPGYVQDKCVPGILEQYPQLGDVDVSDVQAGNFEPWLVAQVAIFGEYLTLQAITETPKSVDLDQLQEETEKLLSLLQDRHPGLPTWNKFFSERADKVHSLLSQVAS